MTLCVKAGVLSYCAGVAAVSLKSVAVTGGDKGGADWGRESQEQHEQYLAFVDKWAHTRRNDRDSDFDIGFPGRFDWRLVRPDDLPKNRLGVEPKTVFCSSHNYTLLTMLTMVERVFGPGDGGRILYVTGDLLLSHMDTDLGPGTRERLAAAFPGGIWYQAMDKIYPGFRAAPDGMNSFYAKQSWAYTEAAMRVASIHHKPKGVLAAWGQLHPELDAIPARRMLLQWLASPQAVSAGVVRTSLPPDKYWPELVLHKFLLSPRGAGIQSPKNDEALLVLTIPITTREGEPVHDQLKALGWPVVLLDSWGEITPVRLAREWAKLSPRLVSFRKNCLTTDGFWRIITKQIDYCA